MCELQRNISRLRGWWVWGEPGICLTPSVAGGWETQFEPVQPGLHSPHPLSIPPPPQVSNTKRGMTPNSWAGAEERDSKKGSHKVTSRASGRGRTQASSGPQVQALFCSASFLWSVEIACGVPSWLRRWPGREHGWGLPTPGSASAAVSATPARRGTASAWPPAPLSSS